ncbi:hypothetical protein [Micromonospora sp. DH14]|uniref:hypothetical protein n=1 Tax=Micromonospora sp. DH14 TaxID=3040120 RepID=UPI002442A879|nr:hypothetical protein [Micromonospora sp. DH14]MDG9674734.1 hypothetical protein [Micromonospora sp. DH14]
MTAVGRPGEILCRPTTRLDALAAGAAFTLVLVRRRSPLPVSPLPVSALLAAVPAGGQPPALLLVTAVAAYTVATHTCGDDGNVNANVDDWCGVHIGACRRCVRRSSMASDGLQVTKWPAAWVTSACVEWH